MRRTFWLAVLAVSLASPGLGGAEPVWRRLADPVVEDGWIRPPAGEHGAKPVWGLAEGLRIGLAPLPGPRGLLRVFAPYVGQPDWRMINFIAVEPIAEGRTNRSFSELERSSLVEGTGKVMWSVDQPDDWTPRSPAHPARGVIGVENGVKTLTVFIGVERFQNGAAVFLRLTFREDRPCEVQISHFHTADLRPAVVLRGDCHHGQLCKAPPTSPRGWGCDRAGPVCRRDLQCYRLRTAPAVRSRTVGTRAGRGGDTRCDQRRTRPRRGGPVGCRSWLAILRTTRYAVLAVRSTSSGPDGTGQCSSDVLGVRQPDSWRRELRKRRTVRSFPSRPDLDVRRDTRSARRVVRRGRASAGRKALFRYPQQNPNEHSVPR